MSSKPDYLTTPSKYAEMSFAIVDDSNRIYDLAHFDNVEELLKRYRSEYPDKVLTAVIDRMRLPL